MPNPSDVRALVDEAREQAVVLSTIVIGVSDADAAQLELRVTENLLDRLASALEAREGWVLVGQCSHGRTAHVAEGTCTPAGTICLDCGTMLPAAPTPEPAGEGEKP